MDFFCLKQNAPPSIKGLSIYKNRTFLKLDLLSVKRNKEIAAARHVCIFLIRELTEMSYPNISKIFGRDHSTIMTSYNYINGVAASQNKWLLTDVLRGEWGFKGMVETDWGVKNDPVKEVKAGNDMKMPVGYPEDLKVALDNGEITRADLELCAKRILEMIMKLD